MPTSPNCRPDAGAGRLALLTALAALTLSWRRAPVPATYRPGVPRTDPQTPEEIAEEERMKHGPGAWFVSTGCFV